MIKIIFTAIGAFLALIGLKRLNTAAIQESKSKVDVLKGRKEEIAKTPLPTEVPKLDDQAVVDYWKDKI